MHMDVNKIWIWDQADGQGRSNEQARLLPPLLERARSLGFAQHCLGELVPGAQQDRLWLLRRPASRPGAARLLLATGFHGEESAGPWGLLAFLLQTSPALLDDVELSLLPLVNPTGFRAGRRYNNWGENPNRGYPIARLTDIPPSREGRMLLSHADRLVPAGRDGALCCHEDVGLHEAYLYSFEPGATPGAFSQALLKPLAAHFPVHPDGAVDGCPVHAGVVFNHHDGSFESWLVEQGAARAACIETPGQQPFATRVQAQCETMQAFVAMRWREPQRDTKLKPGA